MSKMTHYIGKHRHFSTTTMAVHAFPRYFIPNNNQSLKEKRIGKNCPSQPPNLLTNGDACNGVGLIVELKYEDECMYA